MLAGILEGFTVSNGHTWTSGNYYYDRSGGGVNMYTGNGVVTNCIFMGNSAYYDGGGVSYGTVNNCTINGNSASYGGGTHYGTINNCVINRNSAYYGGGTRGSIVNNCTISKNSASSIGGGTYGGTINNCTISRNSAKSGGGNSANYSGGPQGGIINNCTISRNSAADEGGGTKGGTINNCTISGNSANNGGGTYYSIINNCTITGNSAGVDGGGSYNGTANNCIIWDNSAFSNPNFSDYCIINYSCSTPLAPGEGNFTNNPLLVSASHISPDSSCIGKGTNAFTIGIDIDGESWKNSPSVGCDEVYTNNLTGELVVDIYAEYTSAVVGAALEFKGIIIGKPVSNLWTFGDGNSTPDKYIAKHSFSAAGEYDIILSVFNIDNPAGVSATVMVNIVELHNTTYYVNKSNTTPLYPYDSWSKAATNIQDAVAAAGPYIKHSLVLVTNGVYDSGETVTPGYSCSNRVVITKDIVVKSVNGPENTIILGKGPLGNSAIRGVYMSAGILEGFTVSNGHTRISGNRDYDQIGGGINMYGGNGVVTNCIISGNSANNGGGGTFYGIVNNSTISGNSNNGTRGCTVNNCTISRNSATSGGGTYESTVNNCTISGNSANWGGGTYYSTINNCTITGNTADNNGGGSWGGTLNNCTISKNSGCGADSCTINNCTIIGNSAFRGGGIKGSTANNCIISGNSAWQLGGGGRVMAQSTIVLSVRIRRRKLEEAHVIAQLTTVQLSVIRRVIMVGVQTIAQSTTALFGIIQLL